MQQESIRCHGRCGKEKPLVLFNQREVRAWRRAQQAGTSCRPICRQCRIDRENKTGLYAPSFPAARQPKRRRGWVFRRDSASLYPGSAASYDRWLSEASRKGAA